MGRQIGDSSTMVSSSIALLQERFRELQRIKEKRQEKELLKLFSESSERNTAPPTPSSSSSSSSKNFEPSTMLTFQPHHDMPIYLNNKPTPSPSPSPSPPPVPVPAPAPASTASRYRDSSPSLLSLGLYASESKQYSDHALQAAVNPTSFWPTGSSSSSSSSSRSFEHSDIDTSLHL